MRCALRALAAAVLSLLLSNAAGLAQGVNVIGAVTPGHCASFFSTSQIQDSGSNCGGGGGGGITGPGVSAVGDLAVWNNITGSALADTNLSFPGGFSFAGTLTGATAVTFPTSGTLATTANANVASVTGTTGQVTATPTTGAVVVSLPASITANLTLSGTINHTGPFQVGGNTMTFPATAQTLAGLATAQTWAAVQTFTNSAIALLGSSTGATTFTSANAGASNFTLTFPAVTANLAYLVGTPVTGNCVKFSGTVGGLTDSGAVCGGGGGTPGGANTNIQFNNSSAFGGDAGFTYAGGGQVTHALGTITTNAKAVNITGTWSAVGTTFDAPLFMNIINTASAASSKLFDFQVGGVTVAEYQPNLNTGALSFFDTANTNEIRISPSSGGTAFIQSITASLTFTTPGVLQLGGTTYVQVVAAGNNFYFDSTPALRPGTNNTIDLGTDANVFRAVKTAAMLVGNGASATKLQVYNNVDTLSAPINYERGAFDWTSSANVLTLGTQSGGTGTNRAALLTSSIGVSLSLATAKVVTIGDGAANANGWLQWAGEARVTSDFSVTSSVALVNVTGLSVNVAAGRTYAFATELYVTDAAAGGVQAAIAGTATATAIQYTGYTIADNAIKAKTNATALATAVGSTVTTETAGIIVRITGTITVNAAGTLTVQMAQNTSNATATIAKRGSWFIVNDMP